MAHSEHNRLWRPTEIERRIGLAARLTAEREAARIPWRQLQKARELYIDWEAFALWVRAIEDTEGEFPNWLAQAVERRCQGFFEFAVRQKQEQPGNPGFLWYHLERWIHGHIFEKVWREGWMDAVGTSQHAISPLCVVTPIASIASAHGRSQDLPLIPLSAIGWKPRSGVMTVCSTTAKCERT
jgi:hypothetical protein